MGKGGPRYENPYLQWAALAGRWDVVALLVREIDAANAVWGWKLPALVPHLEQVAILLPNARYVFVTKDVVSIARRRAHPTDGARFAQLIGRTAQAYAEMARFGRKSGHPTLFVAYEDAVRDPVQVAGQIADFCSIGAANVSSVKNGVRNDALLYKSGKRPVREANELDKKLSRICAAMGVFRPDSLYNSEVVAKSVGGSD